MYAFGDRRLGDGYPAMIVFEAGPTHNGVESAKELVTHAANAGADAVKFQILDPDRLMSDKGVQFGYQVLADRATGRLDSMSEPLYDLLKRRALSKDQWAEVKRHADSCGLEFFATIGFDDEIDFVVDIGCRSIKIASADVNHWPLLRKAAKHGLCIQIDTGSSSIGEVEMAVDVIRSEGNDNIVIHHCPSGYPARLDGINLNIIRTLKSMFPFPIGFSDHTPGHDMDIIAVALGANLIEKTITMDRMTRSIEHVFSLEPADMANFVQTIRDTERALGSRRREVSAEEREKRKVGRRSVHLAAAAKAGERLGDLAVEFRRPGIGLAPDEFERAGDARLKRDLPKDHRLTLADIVWN